MKKLRWGEQDRNDNFVSNDKLSRIDKDIKTKGYCYIPKTALGTGATYLEVY